MEVMLWVLLVAGVWCLGSGGAALLAPPWADVRRNPCAAQPRGWLMLYWPPDGNCYTIYKKGHPCPETMELSPKKSGGGKTVAECRCPPGFAQLPMSSICHKLFEKGPCASGDYFAPVEESFNKNGERSGMCMKPGRCGDETQVFWPQDGRCYRRYSQGPCYTGAVLDLDNHGIANCSCHVDGEHWSNGVESGAAGAGGGGCFEHYARGPCERGQLFLPGGRCGCQHHLPHFHNQTGGCYQIDTIGPCPRGHTFSITEVSDTGAPRATCVCKPFHVLFPGDGACYRLYTRGPCQSDEMITRGGRCVRVPCTRGRLYFPERRKCYRPGSPEPCPDGEVVTFDFDARPSIDGVSHNGKCACGRSKGACGTNASESEEKCSSKLGMAASGGACHMLYTRGPCSEGDWLVPGATKGGGASCVCRPGREGPNCVLTTIRLADYLNKNTKLVS